MLIIYSLAVAGLFSPVLAQPNPSAGVVKILVPAQDGTATEGGSGFIVGFDRGLTFIVTAAHVVEGTPRLRVTFAAAIHLSYEATTVRLTEDIAVLKVVGYVQGSVALPLDQRPVQPADPLQAIGFPRRALQPRWTTTAVASLEGGKIVLDEPLAEGQSGGPLLREGWVVGLVNATDVRFAQATPAIVLSQILESWKVPFQLQTSRKPTARAPEPQGDVEPIPMRLPQTPTSSGCSVTVKSRTGSGQPVRTLAMPSAPALLSLPAGTRVAIETSQASSGYRWYKVTFDTTTGRQQGWMQADHLEISPGCPP